MFQSALWLFCNSGSLSSTRPKAQATSFDPKYAMLLQNKAGVPLGILGTRLACGLPPVAPYVGLINQTVTQSLVLLKVFFYYYFFFGLTKKPFSFYYYYCCFFLGGLLKQIQATPGG